MNKFDATELSRRAVIKRTAALSVLALTGISGFMVPHVTYSASLTKAQRDSITHLTMSSKALKRAMRAFGKGKCNSMTS